jgi:hypothetical protein
MSSIKIKIMLGRFIFAVAVGPAVAQPGNHDNAPTEAAVHPAILRKSLLVVWFFIVTPKHNVSALPVNINVIRSMSAAFYSFLKLRLLRGPRRDALVDLLL